MEGLQLTIAPKESQRITLDVVDTVFTQGFLEIFLLGTLDGLEIVAVGG